MSLEVFKTSLSCTNWDRCCFCLIWMFHLRCNTSSFIQLKEHQWHDLNGTRIFLHSHQNVNWLNKNVARSVVSSLQQAEPYWWNFLHESYWEFRTHSCEFGISVIFKYWVVSGFQPCFSWFKVKLKNNNIAQLYDSTTTVLDGRFSIPWFWPPHLDSNEHVSCHGVQTAQYLSHLTLKLSPGAIWLVQVGSYKSQSTSRCSSFLVGNLTFYSEVQLSSLCVVTLVFLVYGRFGAWQVQICFLLL